MRELFMRTLRFSRRRTTLQSPTLNHARPAPTAATETFVGKAGMVRLAVEQLGCRALPGSVLPALGAELANVLQLPEVFFLPAPNQEFHVDLEEVSTTEAPPDFSYLNPLEESADSVYWTTRQPSDVGNPILAADEDEMADVHAEQVIAAAAAEPVDAPSVSASALDRMFTQDLESDPWITSPLATKIGEFSISTSDPLVSSSMQSSADAELDGGGMGAGTTLPGELPLLTSDDNAAIVIELAASEGKPEANGCTAAAGPSLEQTGPLAQLAAIQHGDQGERSKGGGLISPMSLTVTVLIDTPAHNSHVAGGGSFTAFGYVSPINATMTAWVTDNGTQYNGKKIFPVPHNPFYQWGFSFTGIPTGHEVQLTVHAYSQGDTGSHTITITCDA
jgi:hypothetical protein